MLKQSMAALMASLVLVSFAGDAFASSNPIPGVDVIVRKKPGGIAVGQTRTDKDGKFVFDNLTKGSYQIQIKLPPPTAKQVVNTTRSNIKHQGIAVVNGVQVVTIAAVMGTGDASSDVVISSAKGKIVGTVTRARLIGGDYGEAK